MYHYIFISTFLGQRGCVQGGDCGQGRGRGRVAIGQWGRDGFYGLGRGSVTSGSDVYKSMKEDELWQKTCTGPHKYALQNVMRQQLGPMAYAVRQADTSLLIYFSYFSRQISIA